MKACANLTMLFKESGPFLSRYKAAASAGFRFVECDFPNEVSPTEIANELEKNNLQQVLINAFHGANGESGFAATPGKEQNFQDAVNKTLEYCRATKCKRIHLLSGMSLGDSERSIQLETLRNNLQWASNILKEEGVVGLIEPINPVSKPGYFMNSYDAAVSIIEKINSPNIRLQLDLFHLQMMSGNVTNNIERLLPFTGHMQVAQSPHRNEPSMRGELNMEYVFDQLRSQGYDGYIGFEYNPSGITIDSLSWMKNCGIEF